MSVPEQNAPDLREEGSFSSSSDRFHFLVQKAVADSMASVTRQISSLIDTRFDNFKEQFTEENSSSVEAAVKRAKRARFVFQSKGNEQQFEHAESVLDKLESAKDALNANATSRAKTDIEEGIALVTKRMKVIKIADRSQYSWATVQEYLSDELTSDSEDEKRLFRSERRAEKKVKEAKKKRSQKYQQRRFQPYSSFNPHLRSSLPTSDTNSSTTTRFGRDLGVRGRQIGPCFKISVNLFLSLLFFEPLRLALVTLWLLPGTWSRPFPPRLYGLLALLFSVEQYVLHGQQNDFMIKLALKVRVYEERMRK